MCPYFSTTTQSSHNSGLDVAQRPGGDAVDTNLDDLDLFPPETLSYSYDMQTLKALLDCYIQATTLQI